jgi:hypothetical protein
MNIHSSSKTDAEENTPSAIFLLVTARRIIALWASMSIVAQGPCAL